jgi:hypothetical protein
LMPVVCYVAASPPGFLACEERVSRVIQYV